MSMRGRGISPGGGGNPSQCSEAAQKAEQGLGYQQRVFGFSLFSQLSLPLLGVEPHGDVFDFDCILLVGETVVVKANLGWKRLPTFLTIPSCDRIALLENEAGSLRHG
ncbi:hypothetical protein TNCT_293151 [Trichonephila clavata]|uniref:Uncharacterized protein n=1 Tax=Trichonephila clavata TaxID=2740835 RepID=A0A8X6LMC3_TRICU|nr:hypothetical protein TNCT_293151 [Trichonephila clavata]